MTTRSPHPRTPDGALVRVVVRGEAWAEGIPPVPAGADVTVTFTEGDAALVHGDALVLLGYRVVGVQAPRSVGASSADFLVPQRVLEEHTTWWRALCGQADRAFSLASGPVLASLAEVLRAHLEPLRETGAVAG